MSLDVDFLRRHEGPVVWGVSDCVQFAADARHHYGGRRPELPQYASEREALEIIAAGGGLEALVTHALGEPIHAKDAQIGDTVLTCFAETGHMLGVADPPWFWVRAARGGFLPLALSFATRVWSCRV
jgi:uncharacterized protein DUF6950